MKLIVKIEKEGRTYTARCKDYGLFAEATTKQKAISSIVDAFFFALESKEFVAEHAEQLSDFLCFRSERSFMVPTNSLLNLNILVNGVSDAAHSTAIWSKANQAPY